MPIVPRTKKDVIANVKSSLGEGVVKLELKENHFSDSYEDALRWFIAMKGLERLWLTPFVEGKQDYEVPDDVDEVTNVIMPMSGIEAYLPYEADLVMLGLRGIPARDVLPNMDRYSSLVQQFQYAEMSQRVLGNEFDWEWLPDMRILRVYARRTFTPSGNMLVEYISDTIDLRMLNVRCVDIIVRWMLADCKERLGRIRSKYSEWMMAGGPKTMDGDALLAEASTEKEALQEEIMGLSYPIAFISR